MGELPKWCDERGVLDVEAFLADYEKDDNNWWRLDSGYMQAVVDWLIERAAGDNWTGGQTAAYTRGYLAGCQDERREARLAARGSLQGTEHE